MHQKMREESCYELWYLYQTAINTSFRSGHSTTVGCSKCKKKFPGSFGNKTFSRLNRKNWESRTNEEHRRQMNKKNRCKTKGLGMSVHLFYNMWLLLLILDLACALFNMFYSRYFLSLYVEII